MDRDSSGDHSLIWQDWNNLRVDVQSLIAILIHLINHLDAVRGIFGSELCPILLVSSKFG